MGGSLTALLASTLCLGAFDPRIDGAREPPQGFAITAGIDRLSDTLGFWAEARLPRFANDRLAVTAAGGVGWFPDVIPPREGQEETTVGPWTPFGHARLRIELALRVAESPHRIFVGLGPSVIFPSSDISTTDAGVGVHGGLGLELFAGDRFSTLPIALVAELGATAHLARADARVGEAENAAPLATGLALSVGLRFYPLEGSR